MNSQSDLNNYNDNSQDYLNINILNLNGMNEDGMF